MKCKKKVVRNASKQLLRAQSDVLQLLLCSTHSTKPKNISQIQAENPYLRDWNQRTFGIETINLLSK